MLYLEALECIHENEINRECLKSSDSFFLFVWVLFHIDIYDIWLYRAKYYFHLTFGFHFFNIYKHFIINQTNKW